MNSYELPEADNEHVFKSAIVATLLSGVAQDVPKPKLILLGGQPGSGKSRSLAPTAERDLAASGRPMLIDADQLRMHHPQWQEAILETDVTAAEKTHPDARIWVGKACALGIEKRCNVLFDGTLASAQSTARVIDQFSRAGYEIEVRILAIDARASWLGVLYRYEEKKRNRQPARMTPRQVHDDAFDGIPKTLAAIETDKRVGRIQIVACGGAVLYDNVAASNEARSASEALRVERIRERSKGEAEQYEEDLRQLLKWACERGIDVNSIEGYEQHVGRIKRSALRRM